MAFLVWLAVVASLALAPALIKKKGSTRGRDIFNDRRAVEFEPIPITLPLEGEHACYYVCHVVSISICVSYSHAKHLLLPRMMHILIKGTHPIYPIENIVFQGGGAKGIIYAGSVLALEELGITPYLKRFAAASAGCAPAVYLSLG